MLLAVDIGNTRTKAAVFDGDRLFKQFVFPLNEVWSHISDIISKFTEITEIVTSSVSSELSLPNNNLPLHVIDKDWKFPFKNLYQTPLTLGIDRMVLAAGSVLCYPRMNRLIIDAGTCITYDFVDDGDNYHGGAISPGVAMRSR